jgi:hypothetical protein
MEEAVLFLHILGVLLFFAGIVVAGAAFEAGRRREQPAEISLLLGLARSGALLVAFGALLLFACGIWLVELEDEFGFEEAWVQASIALFVIALVLGSYGGQRPKQARKLATKLAEEGRGDAPVELRALLDDTRARAANYASGALIPVILALMVFKP